MFTGLVSAIGTIAQAPKGAGAELRVSAPGFPATLGASIAVNGICLTVTAHDADGFSARLSPETLGRTTAHAWSEGDSMNLESSLRMGDALDGHLVSGHVDGVAEIISITPAATSRRIALKAPKPLARYIAQKGSVTLDGVSLTVNEVEGEQFSVMVIPHTAEVTTLGKRVAGDTVNIEIDMLARYVERLMGAA